MTKEMSIKTLEQAAHNLHDCIECLNSLKNDDEINKGLVKTLINELIDVQETLDIITDEAKGKIEDYTPDLEEENKHHDKPSNFNCEDCLRYALISISERFGDDFGYCF